MTNVEIARRHVLKLSGVLSFVDEMTAAVSANDDQLIGSVVDRFATMSSGVRASFLSGLDTVALVALDRELTSRANLLGKTSYPEQLNILRDWDSAAQREFPSVGALWSGIAPGYIGRKVERLRRAYPEFH